MFRIILPPPTPKSSESPGDCRRSNFCPDQVLLSKSFHSRPGCRQKIFCKEFWGWGWGSKSDPHMYNHTTVLLEDRYRNVCQRHSADYTCLRVHGQEIPSRPKSLQKTSLQRKYFGAILFCNNYKRITLQSKFLGLFSCKTGPASGSNITKKIFWWNYSCDNNKEYYKRNCSKELFCNNFGQDGTGGTQKEENTHQTARVTRTHSLLVWCFSFSDVAATCLIEVPSPPEEV